MGNILLSPPIAFTILLGVMVCASWALEGISFKRKDAPGAIREPYACGEDKFSTFVQPEYSQFFPFAFFFTILHVVALIIATVPKETLQAFTIAVVYIVGAIVGLFILFRKDQ
jgi:NADH:ubiquinone oxidoreductase subunit 3 (subunit A)